jgi:hypothetical protein
MNIGNTNFAKFAKSTATTVYLMTAVKAIVRPSFNLADKKSDKESRKYSAVNELLYQVVCLGFAFAMIPFFEKGGMMLAEKQLEKIPELKKDIKKISELDAFKDIKKVKGFGFSGFKDVSKFKDIYLKKTFDANEKISEEAKHAMHLVNGGIETGSLLGSIIGLTIMAPKIGHEILHPIMTAMGMKQKPKDVGQPTEIFLADAKVPTEKASKMNVNA